MKNAPRQGCEEQGRLQPLRGWDPLGGVCPRVVRSTHPGKGALKMGTHPGRGAKGWGG